MKAYFTNFNYELQLSSGVFKTDSKTREINKDFEFVFFFMEKAKSILVNQNDYTDEYLNHLEILGLNIPDFKRDGDYEYWWGPLENLEKEKKINSKITSTGIAQRLKFCHPDTQIIYDLKDLDQYIKIRPSIKKFFLRTPFSVSGKGCFILDRNLSIPKRVNLSEGVILEPYLNRKEDYGCFITGKGDYLRWRSIVNNKGRYIGSQAISDEIAPLSYKPQMMLIYNEYMNLGVQDGIQIDSFIYTGNGVDKFYPLCEVNYRKTMGGFLNSLVLHFKTDKITFLMDKKKDCFKGQSIKQIEERIGHDLYQPTKGKGIILLSPENIGRLAFAFIGYENNEVNNFINKYSSEFFF